MGTNFYAHIIPTRERKEKLKKLIDEDNFTEIKNEVDSMYGKIGEYEHEGGIIHLGKRSGGWKFLWNPNWYEVDNGTYDMEQKKWIPKKEILKWYDLNRQSISDFVHREDVEIYDEYGEKYDPDVFMKEMEEWDKTPWINGKPKIDGEQYELEEEKDGHTSMYKRYGDPHEELWKRLGFNPSYFNFYSDGMRFATFTDYS